jgi:hypothetical protein
LPLFSPVPLPVSSQHHVPCYFRKKKVDITDGVADIEGFMEIKFDDQKLIKDLLSGKSTVEPVPVAAKAKGGSAKPPSGELEIGDYVVEVAKSGRSKCRECEQKIDEGALRCGLVERMDRPPFLPSPQWQATGKVLA